MTESSGLGRLVGVATKVVKDDEKVEAAVGDIESDTFTSVREYF